MEEIFNSLLKMSNKYINNQFYNFFINRYNLNGINEINNFFQNIFDINNLLEYLFEIKDKIAIDFILLNEIDDADINDFADKIYKFFNDNVMLLFLINKNINKQITICHSSLLKKAVLDNKEFTKESIPNLDEYIIGTLTEYIINSKFFEFILNQNFIKNMQDIHNFFNNFDINLLKEYIYKNCYNNICEDLSKILNAQIDDNIYEYIYNNSYIMTEIMNRIHINFGKIIYRNFFEQGKYLDKLTQASDLAELDDRINQQTYIVRTDVGNREKAFVDIDHNILVSKNNEIHAQLFNRYVEKDNVRFNRGRRRPTEKDIKSKTNIKCWACGHIANNIYIIDSLNNITIDEVINDLHEYGIHSKIYSFEYINKNIYYGLATREAMEVTKNKKIAA